MMEQLSLSYEEPKKENKLVKQTHRYREQTTAYHKGKGKR